MSIGHKGQTPWNKGIKAWNNGKEWPDTVRENTFRGMSLRWQRCKQQIKINEEYQSIIPPYLFPIHILSSVTIILHMLPYISNGP
ncbi:MAG: hypothetical protein WA941_09340 [Nitrososphaeraceae archaeon]